MAQLSLALFGTFEVTLDGQPVTGFVSTKVRALLAYLAVEATRPHPRERLAELLWPDHPPQVARDSLRQALSTLRQAIGDRSAVPPWLLITRDTLQFNATSDHTLDVATFAGLLAACQGHPHQQLERCPPCMRRLEQVAQLYRGDFLDQFTLGDSAAFEEWAALHHERLRRQMLDLLFHLAAYHEGRGAYDLAHQYAWRQVELDPWREEAHRQLMRVLARSGRRSAALEQYDQCRRVLAADLGVAPAEETRALYAEIQAGTLRPRPAPVVPSTDLPAHVTSFVGREHERVALTRWLADPACRLLTLTGPGGVGKTRLALQVATDLQDDFVDGVAFVSLAALRDPALVAATIGQVLSVTETGGQPLQACLTAYLRPKQMLLLLDNFEHLGAAALLVADLLTACPALVVLVTSRVPLGVYGEHIVVVPPFALPDPAQRSTFEDLQEVGAIRLFGARAQAARSDFVVTPETVAMVAEICRRVDGLPLAIELIAARVRLLAPQELLARLSHRLPVLVGGARDVPARQQTMRDAIAWSYDLLTPQEQALFARLGVFAGGFTLDAAEAVCGDGVLVAAAAWQRSANPAWSDGLMAQWQRAEHQALRELAVWTLQAPPLRVGLAVADIAPLLESLMTKSLVREGARDGEPGFMLLETIREYALERLVTDREAAAVSWRHAAYYAALLLTDTGEQELYAGAERELANLREVLAWAVHTGAAEPGLLIIGKLRFWEHHVREGQQWLAQLLQGPHPASYTLSLAVNTRRSLAFWTHDYAQSRQAIVMMRGILDALGEPTDVLEWALGLCATGDGQITAARHHFAAYLARLGADDPAEIGNAHYGLGGAALRADDPATAQTALETALAYFIPAYGQMSSMVAATLAKLGYATQQQGRTDQALVHLHESLAIARARGYHAQAAQTLAALGYIAFNHAAFDRSAVLFGAAEALSEAVGGGGMDPDEHYVIARTIAELHDRLAPALLAAQWATGRAMTLEQAVAYAVASLSSATQVPPHAPPPPAPPVGLTKREVEVLRLLAQGLTYAQMAERLVLSPHTVNAHLKAIYGKLGVTSRGAAARIAVEQHLA